MRMPELEEGTLSTVFNAGSGRRSRFLLGNVRPEARRKLAPKPCMSPSERQVQAGAGRQSRALEGIEPPAPETKGICRRERSKNRRA